MSIRTSFNPLGTLGGVRWPAALTDGLLDGWLMRAPKRTAKGLAVSPPTTTTGNTANSYKFASTPPLWTPKTLLFCSVASFRAASAYNPPSFLKEATGGFAWNVTFYGIKNLSAGDPLEINNGIIIDTPKRYQNRNFYVATPFAAVVTNNEARWRAYATGAGWFDVPASGGTYNTKTLWQYCAAWAAYDSVLSDSEAIRRLELLRQFTNG